MKRKVEALIDNWYKNNTTPHLYITGMRGTGKTTLISDYLSAEHDREQLYINFETDFEIRNFILRYLTDSCITEALASYFNTSSKNLRSSVIIIDELHCAGDESLFFSSLQVEKDTRFIFIDSEEAAGSETLPECFTHIRVNPLTFDEFLDNTGKEWYHEVIEGHFERNRAIPELVHNEINDIYTDYLSTGGMPVIVKGYLENAGKDRTLFAPEELQLKELRNILMGIEEYESGNSHKMTALIENTVSQYINENRHFILRQLIKGSSNAYYAEAIKRLCQAGILIKSRCGDRFRLFWSDTGLLAAKIKASTLCNEDRFNEIINKNAIAQQLYAKKCNHDLYGINLLKDCNTEKNCILNYWCSGNSSEVDFIIDDNSRKKAVKYIGNSKKKIRSLQIYEETDKTAEKTAVGYNNFYIMGAVKIIPQYAVFCL